MRDARRRLQQSTEAGLVSRGRGLRCVKTDGARVVIVGVTRGYLASKVPTSTRCIAGFADSTVRIWRRRRRRQEPEAVKPWPARLWRKRRELAGGARYALSSATTAPSSVGRRRAERRRRGRALTTLAARASLVVHSPSSSESLGGGRIFATGGADRTCSCSLPIGRGLHRISRGIGPT